MPAIVDAGPAASEDLSGNSLEEGSCPTLRMHNIITIPPSPRSQTLRPGVVLCKSWAMSEPADLASGNAAPGLPRPGAALDGRHLLHLKCAVPDRQMAAAPTVAWERTLDDLAMLRRLVEARTDCLLTRAAGCRTPYGDPSIVRAGDHEPLDP